jgi:hypothetical protein
VSYLRNNSGFAARKFQKWFLYFETGEKFRHIHFEASFAARLSADLRAAPEGLLANSPRAARSSNSAKD